MEVNIMKNTNKKSVFFFVGIMVLLLIMLTACSTEKSSDQSNQSDSVSEQTTDSDQESSEETVTSNGQLQGQDLTDITKLAIPDEVVFLHDGERTIYEKGDPKFQLIIYLNNARQGRKLGALKLAVDFQNYVWVTGDYLIYQYTSTDYVPVYFSLLPSKEGRFPNYVVNCYSPNGFITEDAGSNPTKIFAHGHLAPADALLDYLSQVPKVV